MAISVACPSNPKPVTSEHAWTGTERAIRDAVLFSATIDAHGRAKNRARRLPLLERRRDDPGSERLGQHQRVAFPDADVANHAIGMDDAGDRHAVLQLRDR